MGAGAAQTRPRIGVSRCLLGDEVRYDAKHKRDDYVAEVLAPHVELVAVCPEVEAGFGVPREAMQLEGDPGAPTLRTRHTERDLSERMRAFSRARVGELLRQELDGFVLKSNSPSCGAEGVPVYGEEEGPHRSGRGLFADALITALPDLPVEEEGTLRDARLRENFVVRVFAHRRLRRASRDPHPVRALIDFHTRHELLLMSRDERRMRELGRLVAEAAERDSRDLYEPYRRDFFDAMRCAPTAESHANTLQHLAGHVRARIDDWDRRELDEAIERYRLGQVPLWGPMTLLRHHSEEHEIAYALRQVYLWPPPGELNLLSRV